MSACRTAGHFRNVGYYITVNITNFNATGTAQRWQLTSANDITQLANITITNKVLSDTVPAQSIRFMFCRS